MAFIGIRNFFTKLLHWEYWPLSVVYAPVYMYWFYLAAKARALFFFTASNPSFKNGGMVAASKYDILTKIPQAYLPKTIRIVHPVTLKKIEEAMKNFGFEFPVIFKPDEGERGWRVERISSLKETEAYLHQFKENLLLQEYLELPFEAGVFYYRLPGQAKGTVSSVVVKEMLHVTGDGRATLQELILAKPRARLQWKNLRITHRHKLNYVPKLNEQVNLQPIGNHNRGTMFKNGNHLITEQLINSFDAISKQIDGFYYGRFDVRCQSPQELEKGQVKIMELNGAASEPAHIYQPGFSLFKAYKVLFHHWSVMYKISIANHKNGVPYTSFKQGWLDVAHSTRVAEQGI